MGSIFDKMEGGMVVGLLIVALLLGTIVIGMITHHWRCVRIAELEAALKQQMIEKGMAVNEIEQVLQMGTEKPSERSAANDNASSESSLVAIMVEHEVEAEDMELILQAFHEHPERAQEKVDAVENMVENGMSGEDVARVIRAMHLPATPDSNVAGANQLQATTAPQS